MKDKANQWLLALPIGLLTIWEAVETKFFSKYYPSWKTQEIQGKIATYAEDDGEAFHETWDRYKLLLAPCPHYLYFFVLQVQYFYDGLSDLKKETVDNACGGAMSKKTIEEVHAIYEMLGQSSQRRSGRSSACEDKANSDLTMQVANLSKEVKNLKANLRKQGPVMNEVQAMCPSLEESLEKAATQLGQLAENYQRKDNEKFSIQVEQVNALTIFQSSESKQQEVLELEESSKRVDEYLDELSLILDEDFGEDRLGKKETRVEVAQENKELISQNMDLKIKINSLEKERDSSLKEIKELKDDFAQSVRLMQAEIEAKDEALEIMKTRELDHLAELAKAKQELKAKKKEVIPLPKEDKLDLSQGISSAMVEGKISKDQGIFGLKATIFKICDQNLREGSRRTY
ncbi:hypothetical protein Dsin_008723 [Dipteronia sinensis]|uniref:Uncharacterized protein n=1 Tax=Dipteronia sinensis TaxID=43782 RepID=A0AAE0AP88_9ROSI|nr:hypothetical protein Dsin_008723 [Dipteronia sinensis]